MIRLGLGRHIWTVAPENVLPILKRLFAVYYCYNAGLTVAKASCLLFYTRIFSAPRTSTWLSRAIWITHALNFGVWMGSVLLVSFNYNPKSQTSTGYRPSTVAMWLSSAVPGVLIDLVLLILPLPMIWKLRINRGRKIAVLGVFVCGYWYVYHRQLRKVGLIDNSVIVVSLGRLITITKGKDMDQDLLCMSLGNLFLYATNHTRDIGIPSIYWQAAEGPMTLLCICLPSTLNLWRSVTSVAKSKFSSHTSGSNGHTPDSPERTNTKARTKNSVPSTFDTELSNFAVGDNNSGDGSESMILIPQDTHHSYVTNIQKPPNVLVLKTEPLDPNIHVQNDFYVSRNSAKNWR
jgi:hypothetical protein